MGRRPTDHPRPGPHALGGSRSRRAARVARPPSKGTAALSAWRASGELATTGEAFVDALQEAERELLRDEVAKHRRLMAPLDTPKTHSNIFEDLFYVVYVVQLGQYGYEMKIHTINLMEMKVRCRVAFGNS